jgi:hypothetical protein
MKEVLRSLVVQVKLIQYGKMIHLNNQEMLIKLPKEEFTTLIGLEPSLFN